MPYIVGLDAFHVEFSSCAPAVKEWRLGADAVVDGQRLGDHGGRVAGAGWQQHGVARLGDVAKGRQVLCGQQQPNSQLILLHCHA